VTSREVYLKIDGRMVYLWRAVDAEGEVLDVLVQSKRNKHAALKLMRKLLKKYALSPSGWSRTTCDHMASNACMSAGDGETIGSKIRISRPDHGSARCNVSRALVLRRNSSQPTPPFTIFSTSNAISYQLNRIACSAPRR
jgi:transposase-like protein